MIVEKVVRNLHKNKHEQGEDRHEDEHCGSQRTASSEKCERQHWVGVESARLGKLGVSRISYVVGRIHIYTQMVWASEQCLWI